MTIFEFFALFSFSFASTVIIGTLVLGFLSARKKKKAIKELNSLRDNILITGGLKHEIKKDN